MLLPNYKYLVVYVVLLSSGVGSREHNYCGRAYDAKWVRGVNLVVAVKVMLHPVVANGGGGPQTESSTKTLSW